MSVRRRLTLPPAFRRVAGMRFSTFDRVFTTGVMVALALAGLIIWMMMLGRSDALDYARGAATNLAQSVERDVARSFEFHALSLSSIVAGFQEAEVMALPERLRKAVLFDQVNHARYVRSAFVLDASGAVVIRMADGGPTAVTATFSDREYFRVHQADGDRGLFVSAPFLSRLTGGPTIAISRKIADTDGRFLGVAAITIDVAYFNDVLGALDLGPHGSAVVIMKSGALVARKPEGGPASQSSLGDTQVFRRLLQAPAGSFLDTSPIDGVRRLYVFRAVDKLPLIVVIAPSEKDTYAAWVRRTAGLAGILVVFALAFVMLAWLLRRELRRREAAEKKLRRLATTDALTSLPNRRALATFLEEERARTMRNGAPLCALFIDVDYFKLFNDSYGHQAGDEVLVQIAQALRNRVRRVTDRVARYGGEEFVVILVDTPLSGGETVARALCEAVERLAIPHSASAFGRVTVSIGVACSSAGQVLSSEALLAASDAALYRAKQNGRNRLSF